MVVVIVSDERGPITNVATTFVVVARVVVHGTEHRPDGSAPRWRGSDSHHGAASPDEKGHTEGASNDPRRRYAATEEPKAPPEKPRNHRDPHSMSMWHVDVA